MLAHILSDEDNIRSCLTWRVPQPLTGSHGRMRTVCTAITLTARSSLPPR